MTTLDTGVQCQSLLQVINLSAELLGHCGTEGKLSLVFCVVPDILAGDTITLIEGDKVQCSLMISLKNIQFFFSRGIEEEATWFS